MALQEPPLGTPASSPASPSESGRPSLPKPGNAGVLASETPAPGAIRFTDVSEAIRHRHEEMPFDDFERQPLLPRRLSQLGPGVAWWDLDGDGQDDLVVGAGRGGRLAGFRNLGRGRFASVTGQPWDRQAPRDFAGLAGWGRGTLLVAAANYEDGLTNEPAVIELSLTNALPKLMSAAASLGPLAVADYDGDGDLDVFVGARAVGGRYPEPAPSALWRKEGPAFELDGDNAAVLPPALVSGAIWTDLTGDGWPELVLACDWGPIRIFRNERGRLSEWNVSLRRSEVHETRESSPQGLTLIPHPSPLTPQLSTLNSQLLTLNQLTGWWNGIAAGDFDNDGRLDLLASNWGGNTRYERWRPSALRLYFGDFNEDGVIEILESHSVAELRAYAPDRMLDAVTRALPRLADRFPTHQKWAEATMNTVLGEWRESVHHLEAAWLETTLFLNRGDHFEVRPLPTEAQFAPAFAVCVGDADGDGNEDVFLSQNFFGVDMDTSRYDAGRGLWLRGDGWGGLAPVRGQDCGVRVYGEQRGAALADFDADGRVDFVVTQNSAETKLYQNVGAKPGLRVRLEGPSQNPVGIGAVMRLRYGENGGPAREIRAGSGYWSQDSPVQVLGLAGTPTAIEVRWPGGRVTNTLLPANVREIKVRADGGSEMVAR